MEPIALDTAQLVLAWMLSPEEAARLGGAGADLGRTALLRAAAHELVAHPDRHGSLLRRLDAQAPRLPCVAAAAHLFRVLLDADAPGSAALVVWAAGRTPGLAWRRFEARARTTLALTLALRCPHAYAARALAAK